VGDLDIETRRELFDGTDADSIVDEMEVLESAATSGNL
jgi:hypothetical protein